MLPVCSAFIDPATRSLNGLFLNNSFFIFLKIVDVNFLVGMENCI